MKVTLSNTKENNAKVQALRAVQNIIGKIYWVGNVKFNTLDKALMSISFNSLNSGWYNPVPVSIKGLIGIYMINEDGSLFAESRIIKENDTYLVEHLRSEGYNKYESLYFDILDNKQP